MGKVKRYVLRTKGRVFLNKQCVTVLEQHVAPRMTSIRRETYRMRKKISWRDTLNYLWQYYKKHVADGNMDLRLYHEHRGATYASSKFKQTGAIQGYRRGAAGRLPVPTPPRARVRGTGEPPRRRGNPQVQTATPGGTVLVANTRQFVQTYIPTGNNALAGRFDEAPTPPPAPTPLLTTADWAALGYAPNNTW